jgi:hypothetical protein
MSLDTRLTYAQRASELQKPPGLIGLRANLGERIVTCVAVGLAVLAVAAIAVLMGMA